MSEKISEIEISTNEYRPTRRARIDGSLYEVRRPGAGDKLDISRLSRELLAQNRKAMNLRGKIAALQDMDETAQNELLDEMESTLGLVNTAQEKLENCYVKLFVSSDGEGDPAALVHSVGTEAIGRILDKIFSDNP
jgi:hypothetical protein